jgi:hypothetical protein
METRNAVIFDTGIGIEEHGVLAASIWLDYGDSKQALCRGVHAPKNGDSEKNYAGYFIYRVLAVAGVNRWEQLKGKAVRVMGDSAHIEAIGHIIEDVWFNPGEEFKSLDQEVSA